MTFVPETAQKSKRVNINKRKKHFINVLCIQIVLLLKQYALSTGLTITLIPDK